MEKERKSPFQSVLAAAFGILIALSVCFMAYRAATKPAYVRREVRQVSALAKTTALALAGVCTVSPDIGQLYGTDKAFIVINHMKVEGNWVITAELRFEDGGTVIEASAKSGWNSRSPQSAEYSVRVAGGRVTPLSPGFGKILESLDVNAKGKELGVFTFTYLNDRACPAPIKVRLIKVPFKDGDVIIVKSK